jgi:hypothetical protein
MRTDDVAAWARCLAEYRTTANRPNELHLVAIGQAAVPALHAAALDADRFAAVRLRNMISSWTEIVRTPGNLNQAVNVVHGALKQYDLPAPPLSPGTRWCRNGNGPHRGVLLDTSPSESLCYRSSRCCWTVFGTATGTGKLVRIQHGPATVIGDESRLARHCPRDGKAAASRMNRESGYHQGVWHRLDPSVRTVVWRSFAGRS